MQRKNKKLLTFTKADILQLLIISVLPFVLYWQTLDYAYVLDDKIVLSENDFVRQGVKGISDIFTHDTFDGYQHYNAKTNPLAGGRYRPLSLVMFALEYELLATKDPNAKNLDNEHKLRAANHFINILLYALIGVLIFILVKILLPDKAKLMGQLGVPFLAALLFVLHPVHVEVVANIKSRDELMMLFFSLLTMIYAMKYSTKGAIKYGVVTAVLCVLAILSKENALTLLAIVPMTAYFFDNKTIKGALVVSVPIFVAVAFYFTFRTVVVGDLGGQSNSYLSNAILNNPFAEASASDKYATIFFTLGKYLQLLVFPHPLTHDYYPHQIPIMGWGNIKVLLSLAAYLGLLYYALKTIKTRNLLAFCILFYFGTLFITSNFVVNIGTFMNERFLFLPSLAFCIALAYLLVEVVPQKLKNNLATIASVTCIALLGIGFVYKNFDRIPDWKDPLVLSESAAITSPQSIRANQFYAYQLYLDGLKENDRTKKKTTFDKAYTYVNKALAMYPDYSQALTCKSGLVAELYKFDQDLDKLLQEFHNIQIVRITPFIDQYLAYLEPRVDNARLAQFYTTTGNTLLQKGQTQKGQAYLAKAQAL